MNGIITTILQILRRLSSTELELPEVKFAQITVDVESLRGNRWLKIARQRLSVNVLNSLITAI